MISDFHGGTAEILDLKKTWKLMELGVLVPLKVSLSTYISFNIIYRNTVHYLSYTGIKAQSPQSEPHHLQIVLH